MDGTSAKGVVLSGLLLVRQARPIQLAVCWHVSTSAYRKGSLNLSGAALAGVLALTTLWLCPASVFAIALLGFFFSGSRATKYKAAYKAQLEEQDSPASSGSTSKHGHRDTASGNRDWKQVACNGLFGSLACLLWIYEFGDAFKLLFQGRESYAGMVMASKSALSLCPVGQWSRVGSRDERISRALVFAAVGFWSACMGDTLSSELGMLSKSAPRLITTLQPVVPGTNGGVTPWGTAVSFLGGLFISLLSSAALLVENRHCRTSVQDYSHTTLRSFCTLVVLGGIAGLMGSLLDSFLGATLQRTVYSKTRKMVLHHIPQAGEALGGKTEKGEDIQIKGRDVLSNNGVNAVSTVAVGLACAWVGWQL